MPGGDLRSIIAEVVSAAGEGMKSLRRAGSHVVVETCSIEVTLDDHPVPAASVRIELADRSARVDLGLREEGGPGEPELVAVDDRLE